jgi:hypothetical protein
MPRGVRRHAVGFGDCGVTTPDTKVVNPAVKRRPPAAGKGRKKGSANKSTLAVKEALQHAFQGLGGVPALQNWATQEPTEFYKLWAKLLPTEVKATIGGELTMAHAVDRPPRETREQWEARRAKEIG